MFIDSILKHADVSPADLPAFLTRLTNITKLYGVKFVVSVSLDKEEMVGIDFSDFEVLN